MLLYCPPPCWLLFRLWLKREEEAIMLKTNLEIKFHCNLYTHPVLTLMSGQCLETEVGKNGLNMLNIKQRKKIAGFSFLVLALLINYV